MRISQETIEQIKSRIDIVDVIGEFMTLKKVGMNFRGKSPFSNEKTPSFFVFPKNENFKDFSSGKAGDAITFLMEYDGLSYTEALLFLAKKYGIEVREEEVSPEKREEQNERESLLIVSNFAKNHYVQNLWETDEGKRIGLSYFKERGFTEDTIRKFELGYSLDAWDDLEKAALKQGYKKEYLEKTGLVVRKESANTQGEGEARTYDRFRGRVIFPIHSNTGKAIAFGARILTSDKNAPKYLNSPESDIYHKSSILYGIFQARRAIKSANNCYLVEGYTDVVSMHQAGVENVVASSGTSLTEEQIKLIGRHTENVTVLFDGDEAGIKASMRGIDMILEQGLNVRALVFPDGDDPDSYAKKVGDFNFREYIKDNSRDFISFKTELFARGSDKDPIKKAETINNIVGSIAKIPDPVKRTVYLKETGTLLDIEEETLIAELNKIILQKRREQKKDRPAREEPSRRYGEGIAESTPDITVEETTTEKYYAKSDPLILQERECLRLLICYGFNEIEDKYKLYDHYLEELEGIDFHHPLHIDILATFKENIQQEKVVNAEYFLKNGSEEVKQFVTDLVSSPYEVSGNWQRYSIVVPQETDILSNSVYTNLLRLKFRKIKKLIESNKRELKSEKDPDKQMELLKIHGELKKAEIEFAKPLGIVIS